MKSEITEVIADLVRHGYADIESRLEYQAESLHETKCINPIVGRWIDAHDVEYLLSAFALGDQDFANRFPAMANVTEDKRRQFIETFERHFDQCRHCSLKRGYDLELDACIEKACRQNKDTLLRLLRDDEAEGEHRALEKLTVVAVHS